MLISNRYISLLAGLLALSSSVVSQPMEREFGYFIFPIKPGVRNTLAGTMGELRSNHFHTGIDIRTGGRQGLAVLAAAEGHISRIMVSGGGYGYTLYLLHPNGKTTVYAHLKSFRDDIEEFVKENQYEEQSFEVNLFPKPDRFLVKQGDTLAYSGNTGSSGGPHLHFDIRDENQHLLNPLTYGFDEVIDTRTPYAKSLALVPIKAASRIDGNFSRMEFDFSPSNGSYTIEDTINVIGEIGLELYAWDRMNGTRFKTGINQIELFINEQQVFGEEIDSWSFSRARSFYQYVNYGSLVNTGKRYHKLYVDNGNNLHFYNNTINHGLVSIEEGHYYEGLIKMRDSYGNMSSAKFVIHGSLKEKLSDENPYSIKVIRNNLVVTADSSTLETAVFKSDDVSQTVKNSYRTAGGTPVFIWNLEESIPETITIGDTTLKTNLISLVPPRKEYKVFNQYADVYFRKGSLFDSLAFQMSYQEDSILENGITAIGNKETPIKGTITVVMKPKHQVKEQERSAAYQILGNNNYGFAGGIWKDGQLEMKIRSFGDYTILVDSIAPMIKPLIINRDRIVFKLDDKLSGIKEIKADINGEWLLIAGDPKRQQYWAEKRNLDDTYAGNLVLQVTDNVNNIKIYKTKVK